jgi:hypothetical protein
LKQNGFSEFVYNVEKSEGPFFCCKKCPQEIPKLQQKMSTVFPQKVRKFPAKIRKYPQTGIS